MSSYEFVAKFDYRFLVVAARLPRPLALICCALRALFRFCFNLEWRSYSLSQRYVRQATDKCYRELQSQPEKVSAWIRRLSWVLGRFWVESVEEFDVVRLERFGLDAGDCFLTCSRVSKKWYSDAGTQIDFGLTADRNRGLVLLTAHLESLYLPLCHLAARGRPVYLAATQIIENPQVPRVIRDHFQLKKRVLERFLGPNHVVYVEHGMASLVRALNKGAIVVIACDSPSPPSSRGIEVSFLGKRVLMAEGPRWLASTTKAGLALMTVERFGFWKYSLHIRHFELANRCNGDTTASLNASFEDAYKELSDVIKGSPWRWWAADLATQYRQPP